MRLDEGSADRFVVCEEAIDYGPRVRGVFRGDRDLDAVAGGEDHRFGHAVARLQIVQSRAEGLFAECQALPDLDRRRLVADAGDQELHWRTSNPPRRACATHVRAENPSTATVISAALRPRHPAVVRRK